jgi:hypothetical protein
VQGQRHWKFIVKPTTMNENPFKIIEPREQVPENMRKDVMGSVKLAVLVLRFVQLFVGDYSAVILEKFSRSSKKKKDHSEDQNS